MYYSRAISRITSQYLQAFFINLHPKSNFSTAENHEIELYFRIKETFNFQKQKKEGQH